jgi:rare lipoprotein A
MYVYSGDACTFRRMGFIGDQPFFSGSGILISAALAALLISGRAQAQTPQESTGTASYYHSKFEGHKTSSGEVFRQDSLTAAHKTLPFGTRVEVRNLANDSVVVVRINDRLPRSSSRSIDLSLAAARQLDFIRRGLTRVSMRVLEADPAPSERGESDPE